MKKVIVGGTFDILHKGHEALFSKAFSLGEVTLGLTSDNFAKKLKGEILNDFIKRKKNLENFIFEKFRKKPRIIKIENIFGPTLRENFDYLVVSKETLKNALKINQERRKRNKKEIKIITIDMILAEDKKPISCQRIRNGEIDKNGNQCLFCKIVNKKIKAFIVYEDEKFLAFLDKNPLNLGHTLVIPKKHFRFVFDIPYLDQFYKIVKKLAQAIKKAFSTRWINSLILEEKIWHAHLHLIPRFKEDKFEIFFSKTKKLSGVEMKKIQNKIKKEI